VVDIILNKKALAKYLIMVLEALNLNISTFVALAYNGSRIAVRWGNRRTKFHTTTKLY